MFPMPTSQGNLVAVMTIHNIVLSVRMLVYYCIYLQVLVDISTNDRIESKSYVACIEPGLERCLSSS